MTAPASAPAPATRRSRRRAVAWVCCLAVVAVSLGLGAARQSGARTPTQRAAAIDAVVRCPSCEGLSVADSSSSTAVAIRSAVLARVRAGQSDAQVEAFLVSRYGPGILLRPPMSGLAGVVWLLPVAAALAGIVGLAVVFWRRRAPVPVEVSDADRALVDAALAGDEAARAPGAAR